MSGELCSTVLLSMTPKFNFEKIYFTGNTCNCASNGTYLLYNSDCYKLSNSHVLISTRCLHEYITYEECSVVSFNPGIIIISNASHLHPQHCFHRIRKNSWALNKLLYWALNACTLVFLGWVMQNRNWSWKNITWVIEKLANDTVKHLGSKGIW